MKRLALVAVVLAALTGSAKATAFTDVSTQSWTGTGSNESMMIVDFGSGNSYAFGYKFDGSPTGWDMFKDIVQGSGSTFGYTPNGLDTLFDATGGSLTAHGEVYSWGTIIDGIEYDGHQLEDTYYTDGNFVAYWNSTDGTAWTSPSFGATDRTLSDGAWDGYTNGKYDANYNLISPPPTVPVPEPATLAVMSVGAGLLLKRKKAPKGA